MYSVMIVDDEKPVLESISFIIEKFRPELTIAGCAQNGREAVEKAEDLKPDILFIDVRMPGIDGIEALRKIKKKQPACVPLLTTAYERFDIAKEAFDLGVSEYILKPFSKQKILSALDTAVDLLDQQNRHDDDDLADLERLRSLEGAVERLFFTALQLHARIEDFVPFLQTIFPWSFNGGRIGILRWQESDVEANLRDGNLLGSAMKYKYSVLARTGEQELLCFFPMKDNTGELPDSKRMERLMQNQRIKRKGWSFVLGEYQALEHLPLSYRSAREKTDRGQNQLSEQRFLEKIKQWRAVLDHCIRDGDGKIHGLLAEILRETGDREAADRICFELFLYIEHSASLLTGQHLQRGGENDELLPFYQSWAERLRYRLQERAHLPDLLCRALAFIQRNYSHSLQLVDVAAAVDVSPAYLSNLFSRHLRHSFIDELTSIRLEKAKRLLRQKELSIKEISLSVGYKDPNYFSRTFKTHVGMVPSAYQDKY